MSDQYLVEVYKIELTPTLKNPNSLKRWSAVFTRTKMILLLHHIVNPVLRQLTKLLENWFQSQIKIQRKKNLKILEKSQMVNSTFTNPQF